jgi:hypothetical protein
MTRPCPGSRGSRGRAALAAAVVVGAAAAGLPGAAPSFVPPPSAPTPTIVVDYVDALPGPLIGPDTPGAVGIKYGFEGGAAFRACGGWWLAMTEMDGDPHWVNTTLGLWSSWDGRAWSRASTLGRGSGNVNGSDPRSHLDAPMLVFNATTGHWELFYVAYWHGTPGCAITSCNGSLWRAVAAAPGCDGLAGPYIDVGPILSTGGAGGGGGPPQPWEGDQGDDSISPPFPAPGGGGGWLAAYGSSIANASDPNGRTWGAGMMSAPSLAGPWTRAPYGSVNPISAAMGTPVENPLIYPHPPPHHPPPGAIVAGVDVLWAGEAAGLVGYAFSADGLAWTPTQTLEVSTFGAWFRTARTPQGLVPAAADGPGDGGQFWLYFTGEVGPVGGFPYYGVTRAAVTIVPPAA